MRLNSLPLMSQLMSMEAYLSLRNSMLFISENVPSSRMYERLAAGMMSKGNGTLFH